jgi:AraC-like DNA-binding protein
LSIAPGYPDYRPAEGMRLAFDRHLGVSPREYRRRFASSTVM